MTNTKLTKKALREHKKNTDNKLEKYVAQYIIEEEDPESFLKDLFYGGCQSGMVGSLIYYKDTLAFYNKYQKEITALLYDVMEETGLYSLPDTFGDKWEKEDPLAIDIDNQNLLAWFGFEYTARRIANALGYED